MSYDFGGWHLGVVADGADAVAVVRGLAGELDARLLLAERGGGMVWAWMGRRDGFSPVDPGHLARALGDLRAHLALGEPGEGVGGWRLTHRQAIAALPVARCGSKPVALYVEVAALSAVLHDDLCARFLRMSFMAPLGGGQDERVAAKRTLRAYFAADRNVTSAAAALGVSRQAVRSRLRTIEARLGRALSECATELELALRLDELELAPNRKAAP